MALDREHVVAALPAYTIGEELGRGAWGIVLAGRHRQLGREVAIKQLPRAFGADPAVRGRFVEEARMLALLDHPHIVPIYDFVEYEGLCLLVMERLTGGTVGSRSRSGGLSPEASCGLVLATCAALHHAHQRAVLHRDVKPDNLMFSADGVLKVTDFGIAKVVGGSATLATRTGEVLGTPAYMAPEQAEGEELRPATDVYAVGTVLYELLAGRLPFREDSNPVALLYRHVHEKPLPLAEVAPAVPANLAGVTMQALERRPENRYPSAEEFGMAVAGAALEAWGSGWLGRAGTAVASTGRILSAAHGEQPARAAATVVEPAIPARETLPAMPPAEVGPADLVSVTSLRPDPESQAPRGPREPDAAAPVVLSKVTSPPVDPPAEVPHKPEGVTDPTRRRLALAALVALVTVPMIVFLAFRGGDRSELRRATAPTSTSAPAALRAASEWRPLHDAPSARQQLAASVAGGTIWLFGGLEGDGATARVDGYDPAIDTWKAGPALPVVLHHQMAVTYRGELVVLGGWVPDGPNLTAQVSERVFALRSGSWVELPPLNRPRAAGAASVVGNRIVVMGGQAGGELIGATEVFDGSSWKDVAPIPVPLDHLGGASDGRFVYAVGGRALSADKNSSALQRYDPAADRWEQLADLPTPRGGIGAAVVGNRLIAVGGESPTGVFDAVEVFDLEAGAWSSAQPMRTPRHGLVVVAVGRSVYAIGGAKRASHTDSSATNEALSFLAAAPTVASAWRQLQPAPTARQQLAATVADGTIWVFGGLQGDDATSRVEGYDAAINTWKAGPDLPIPLHHQMAATYRGELVVLGGWVPVGDNLTAQTSDRVFALRAGKWVELPKLNRPRAAGAAAVVGDKLVVMGGQVRGGLIGTVEVFDGERWKDVAAMPTARDHLATAADGRYVYAVGGRALSADKNVSALERYDPAANRWEKLPDLPTARGGLGAAVVGTHLVVVGGESPTGVFDSVEVFDIAAGEWSTGPPMRTPRHGMAVVAVGRSVYVLNGGLGPSHADSSPSADVVTFS